MSVEPGHDWDQEVLEEGGQEETLGPLQELSDEIPVEIETEMLQVNYFLLLLHEEMFEETGTEESREEDLEVWRIGGIYLLLLD